MRRAESSSVRPPAERVPTQNELGESHGDPVGPVLIVGAGPTGLTLANLLGGSGIDILLVERNPATGDLPRAVSFDDESMRTLQAAGLDREAYEIIVQGTGTKYFGADGRPIAYQRGPLRPPLGHPVKNPFSQPEFEKLLLAGLDRFPNVTVQMSSEVVGLDIRPGGAVVTVRSLDGTDRPVGARMVVGCDGGRSPVREWAGIGMTGSSLEQPWIVVDTVEDHHDERYAMHHCDPQRPLVIVAGRDGRCRYELMLLPGEDAAAMTAVPAVQRLLAPFRTITAEQIERCIVYTFHALVAQRWREGPVLLAGDAAHMMPPFAGQGLNSGMRDAANLAWKIRLVAEGSADDTLLDTYEVERRPHAEASVRFSRRLGTVMMTRNALLSRGRDVLLRTLTRIPAVDRYVSEGRFRPVARFGAGGALVPSPEVDVVGRMLPQPEVLRGDGTRVRLDTVLGNGFAVIGVDVVPELSEHALWDALQPRLLQVLVGDRAPRRPTSTVETVADVDGSLTTLLGECRGSAVLVRPDRFIAAVLPAGSTAPLDELAHAFGIVTAPVG